MWTQLDKQELEPGPKRCGVTSASLSPTGLSPVARRLPPWDVLKLQRSLGNTAVCQLISDDEPADVQSPRNQWQLPTHRATVRSAPLGLQRSCGEGCACDACQDPSRHPETTGSIETVSQLVIQPQDICDPSVESCPPTVCDPQSRPAPRDNTSLSTWRTSRSRPSDKHCRNLPDRLPCEHHACLPR